MIGADITTQRAIQFVEIQHPNTQISPAKATTGR
jgi:hypothetical protein